MKLLWVKTDFLHPTERGGQIRTLEMVRRLHQRHEVHYVALADPAYPEGVRRAGEYSSFAYPVEHTVTPRSSPKFWMQLAKSVFSPLPFSVERYKSEGMWRKLEELASQHHFDRVVCDFVFPALNIPFFSESVLFQHNLETMIWRRHAETAPGLKGRFFQTQADRMFRYERDMCKRARHIVVVSEADAKFTDELFGLHENVSVVPTGVDCDYFASRGTVAPFCDLIFVGSMDWMPNIDGMEYFVQQIWPRLKESRPGIRLGIVGRLPGAGIRKMADDDPQITVTGTVPDVRPYLWGSQISIVPLRIGGGTRLKIYESMAAGVPVVSTSIGAEGLPVRHGETIQIADDAESFGLECERLLAEQDRRRTLSETGQSWVRENYSWESVVDIFETFLQHGGSVGIEREPSAARR